MPRTGSARPAGVHPWRLGESHILAEASVDSALAALQAMAALGPGLARARGREHPGRCSGACLIFSTYDEAGALDALWPCFLPLYRLEGLLRGLLVRWYRELGCSPASLQLLLLSLVASLSQVRLVLRSRVGEQLRRYMSACPGSRAASARAHLFRSPMLEEARERGDADEAENLPESVRLRRRRLALHDQGLQLWQRAEDRGDVVYVFQSSSPGQKNRVSVS